MAPSTSGRAQGEPDLLLGILRERLAAMREVRLAFLFGSRAVGRARRDSDIDIAVLVDGPLVVDAGGVNRMLRHLAGRLGGGEVRSDLLDVVLLNHAPVLLRHHVLRDGVLLRAKDDAERVRFAVQAMRDYQDFAPRLAFHRRWRIARLRDAAAAAAKKDSGTEQSRQADGGRGDILAAARRVGRLLGTGGAPG